MKRILLTGLLVVLTAICVSAQTPTAWRKSAAASRPPSKTEFVDAKDLAKKRVPRKLDNGNIRFIGSTKKETDSILVRLNRRREQLNLSMERDSLRVISKNRKISN